MYPCPGTSCCMQTSPANVCLRERGGGGGGGGGGKIEERERERERVCVYFVCECLEREVCTFLSLCGSPPLPLPVVNPPLGLHHWGSDWSLTS